MLYMIEELINQLSNNIHCHLSKEQVKMLYGISYIINYELVKLSKERDMYMNDLSLIFDKKYIVNHIEDIDENTICYIGDLTIEKELPTYNLRYVYGDIFIDYNLSKLDNLEKVYGNIYVYNVDNNKELDKLSNLDKQRILFIEDIDYTDLILNIKYIEYGELTQPTKEDYNYVLNIIKAKNISSNLFSNLPEIFYTKELIYYFLRYFYSEYELINIKEMENAFKVIPKELLDNETIISILQTNGENIKYLPEYLMNKELILEYVKIAPYNQIRIALEYIPNEYYNDMLTIDRIIDLPVTNHIEKTNDVSTNNQRIYRYIHKSIPLNILLYKAIFYLNHGNYDLPKDIYDLFVKEKTVIENGLEKIENFDKEIINKESKEVPAIDEIINIIPKKFLDDESKVKK